MANTATSSVSRGSAEGDKQAGGGLRALLAAKLRNRQPPKADSTVSQAVDKSHTAEQPDETNEEDVDDGLVVKQDVVATTDSKPWLKSSSSNSVTQNGPPMNPAAISTNNTEHSHATHSDSKLNSDEEHSSSVPATNGDSTASETAQGSTERRPSALAALRRQKLGSLRTTGSAPVADWRSKLRASQSGEQGQSLLEEPNKAQNGDTSDTASSPTNSESATPKSNSTATTPKASKKKKNKKKAARSEAVATSVPDDD
jgi:hypothetical protein